MDEDEHLHRFGTPLEPLDKDEVPAKKPLAIEDQIVKDENGKRRFHGAFTGGFSAGFWNTVGSLEGWTPQNFKSSRGEKAAKVQQRPEDFMDKEDLGEFGIAPQGIRTRDEFSKETEEDRAGQRKRKLMQPNLDGPIPGAPVLEQLLRPVRDKVAVRILKSMGWKPGQGVGPRQTRKEKQQATTRNKREQYLLEHYGTEGLQTKEDREGDAANGNDDDNEEDEDDEEITFAPDDYEPVFYTPKDNRFGMSYTGLSRAPVLSKGTAPAAPMQHINLFGNLEASSKNKKLSIRGQAFGVGAFEEEDEDIYARDDMTSYDFSLGDKQAKKKKAQYVQQKNVIDGFSEDKSGASCQTAFSIDLPRDYRPRNWLQRRSRFAPIDENRARHLAKDTEYKKAGLGRHDLDPEQRAKLLGEETVATEEQAQQEQQQPKKNPFKTATSNERCKSLLERISAKSDNFTRGGLITATGEEQSAPKTQAPEVPLSTDVQQSNAELLEKAAAKTKDLPSGTPKNGFKPFLGDEAKQQRYEKFLEANLKDDGEITKLLSDMQPVTLSLWDREMEKKEFIQAAKIYKPLAGLMLDRFVSEATVEEVKKEEKAKPADQRKIIMERTKAMWKPCAQLCKRYNIAEPFGGAMLEPPKEMNKRPKISIFDYLETSVNTKANFKTPSIIPQHIVPPKPQVAELPQSSISVEKQAPDVESNMATGSAKIEDIKHSPALSITKPTFVPKTALEQAVEASKNKHISEKTDLFKSIFDDSDEEEATPAMAQTAPEDRLAEMKAALGLPGSSNAAAVNLLRNNSPPRGVFAAFFTEPATDEPKSVPKKAPKFEPIPGNQLKIAYKSREERLKNDKELAMADVPAENLYGPRLPTPQATTTSPTTAPIVIAEANIDAKLQQLWQKHAPKKRKIEKWVERKLSTDDDSEDSSSTGSSSSHDSTAPSKSKRSKKTHKSSSKKSKKHKEKSKKKSKKRDKSAHKSKKKKSKR
ncbi:G patch domain-containing protein 1 homolog [Scaptodrosophila lebanonensis]|uniref:G patch domain-containing protein 1 homolog n=1 Tax=Drosophila lebanonensis TaxID=7225 RepID=A0A6J2TAX5_DROLE|nr:G patch domain-containing protein 1 homolog [Scaptodrosophila lebanonensis]